MERGLQSVSAWLLANRERIGPACWELCVLIERGMQISVKRIAVELHKDQRTVWRNLRHLEQNGIIERRSNKPGQANTYRVLGVAVENQVL